MNFGILAVSAVIVVAGRWAERKPLDVPAVLAMFILALMIAGLGTMSREVARGFSLLVLVSVTYVYGPTLLGGINRSLVGGKGLGRAR